MIYRILVVLLLGCSSLHAWSQENTISGNILNREGEALPFATAVLLNPADSTMEYYGISDRTGRFEIKNINKGDYLMQVAFMGYNTMYREVSLPLEKNVPFIFSMEERSMDLEEVEVVGEAVPLMIKGDTVEYNRAAFRLQEDAVVEDLLKKLPGVEVDRAGNIKALGEDVNKVYVDGKEFFGNDPKMATKNIPAKAVDKVQMYDKKSDESEFTGIDDGSREKSLNLVLEEDMKDMIFGNLEAGGGVPSVYEAGARTFYYNEKWNMAGLGMMNNNNNPGFSFGDYMNFRGGLNAMGGGLGQIVIGEGSSFPVNFGQSVNGLNTTAAGGLNASYSKSKFDRIFISYMANASRRDLEESTSTRNYTSSNEFVQNSERKVFSADTAHMVNFGIKKRIDSTSNFNLYGNLSLNRGRTKSTGEEISWLDGNNINSLDSDTRDRTGGFDGSGRFSYLKMIVPEKTILKTGGNYSYRRSLSEYDFSNISSFFDPFSENLLEQYQDVNSEKKAYGAYLNLTQKFGKRLFLEPGIKFNSSEEDYTREQGNSREPGSGIDSLSKGIKKEFLSYTPGLGIRRNTEKLNFNAKVEYQFLNLATGLDGGENNNERYGYILPSVNFDYSFTNSRRITVSYMSMVNEPSASQLLPFENNMNPLYRTIGNPDLEPENMHQLNTHLFIFDQFSFTSFFASLSGKYTSNKINWSRTLDEKLVQSLMPVNVDHDYNLQSSMDFSTPIRKLGIKIHVNLQDEMNQGISIVNDVENEYTGFSHRLSLSLENHKKQKWDASTGIALSYSDSRYSIQENLNNRYHDLSWFGDIVYTPGKTIDFRFSADITNYDERSFSEAILVPLLNSEINYHFTKTKRATLSLRARDILNRDTGIQRLGEMNYLREVKRNTLGRYVMLSLKFRLNKTETNQGFNIELKHGHR